MMSRIDMMQEVAQKIIGELGICWGTLAILGATVAAIMIFIAGERD